MLAEIATIIAPLFLCAGIGVVWGRLRRPFDAETITGLALTIGLPALIFSTLTSLEVSLAEFGEMAGTYALALAVLMTISWPLLAVMKQDVRAFLPVLTFGNSGNLGLPLCLFAFGETGLVLAIGIFVVASIAGLTIGQIVYAGQPPGKALVTNPAVYGIVAALAFMLTGVAPPLWLANATDLVGGISIPLMIISLGVAISKIRVHGAVRALVMSLGRLGLGFAVGFVIAEIFGFTGIARGVLILHCAMPVAVHNYVFAQRYDRRPEEVASSILLSTAISFATLPLLLWVVL